MLFACLPVFCQFKTGYIIKNEGDTLRGLVYNGTAYSNSITIRFKQGAGSIESSYTAKEIKGYGIDPFERFVAAHVPNSPTDQNLFLKKIIDSKVGLFEAATPTIKSAFFIRKPDGSFFFLKKETFLGNLKINLNECPEIDYNNYNMIKTIHYDRKSLGKFIIKYNKCLGVEEVISEKKEPVQFRKGFKLGVNQNTIDVSSPDDQKGKYKGLGFDAGIFARLLVSRKLSVQIEGVYSYRTGSGSKKTAFPTVGYYITDYTFKGSFLDVPVLLKYKMLDSKVSPYILFGPNALVKLNLKSETEVDPSNYRGVDPRTEKLLQSEGSALSNFSFGLNAGAGIMLTPFNNKHTLEIEVRYNYNYLLSDDAGSIGKLMTPKLSLAYGF